MLVFAVVLLLAVFVTLESYAEVKDFYVPSPNEEFYGIWVNTNYSGGPFQAQKIVNYHWGSFDVFMLVNNDSPSFKGCYTFIEKWTDKEGNVLYKGYFREDWTKAVMYSIDRIGNNGNTWEYIYKTTDFPDVNDLKPGGPSYHIYYRK
jgi:hypothetical protein